MSELRLVPITFAQGKQFIYEHHRHNPPPLTWRFGVGLANGDEAKLCGVAMAGTPNARMSMDGRTIEIVRVATDGTPMANSKLYGAILRAAKALGYERAITYTLDSESGASLRATGWAEAARVPGHRDWGVERSHVQQLLFGQRYPQHDGEKIRWEKDL